MSNVSEEMNPTVAFKALDSKPEPDFIAVLQIPAWDFFKDVTNP
jgi:hypothetical protein